MRGRQGQQADRYDELMARHGALQAMVWALLGDHEVGGGASTQGIRLAADGSLDAELVLRHPDGRTESRWFRADPGQEPAEVGPPPRPRGPEPTRSARPADETAERSAQVRRIAAAHLPPAAVEDLVSWLRPALRLDHARPGETVVARLGGLPRLPVNGWPVWEGVGPLNHVLSLDLPAVSALLPELGLPQEGQLAFFYYDGRYLDDVMTTVGSWDPETRHGARVLHLRPDLSARGHVSDLPTPAPPGLEPYREVAMAAVRTVTWPSFELPWVEDAWRRHSVAPAAVDGLVDDLGELPHSGTDVHLVGGHPAPQQGPVEYEVEQFRRGALAELFEWDADDVVAALPRWRSVLQVASDDSADMMWGDVGQLHWLVRDDDPPEQAGFTWQCG